MTWSIVDSHCHLADAAFAGDLDAATTRAMAAGVSSALCILSADEREEVARVPVVRAAWPAVRFAAGVHPHRSGSFAGRVTDAIDTLTAAIAASAAVVVGEIGLDYHYDFAPKNVQRDVFAAQVDVAVSRGLPVAIHTREATVDTLDVLRRAGSALRGVMHCFSGSVDEARECLDLGFHLSISGIVTFPKGGNIREVAAFVPVDRLLVETDAPFLAPVPHRGKRNEPGWVAETLRAVAAARRMEPEALAEVICANFERLVARTDNVPSR
ncbi:MAG: TatD family hydrolase [Acidobacteriota bacterium]